jgi:hypothetical protein
MAETVIDVNAGEIGLQLHRHRLLDGEEKAKPISSEHGSEVLPRGSLTWTESPMSSV